MNPVRLMLVAVGCAGWACGEAPAEYLATPFGYYPSVCVHDAAAAGSGPASCRWPRLSAQTGAGQVPGPPANGWVLDARLDSAEPLTRMTSTLQVPPAPAVSQGQLVYLFSAMVPAAGDVVLQPVLQWGQTLAGGGDRWTLSSWSCGRASCTHSALLDVSPGDLLTGTISGSNCSAAGQCDWHIAAVDTTSGQTTALDTTGDSSTYVRAYAGVLEAYRVSSCNQYPASGRAVFSAVGFTALSGAPLAGSFMPEVVDPGSCADLHVELSPQTAVLVFDDVAAPVVELRAPRDGADVAGAVTVIATALAPGNTTLQRLRLFIDGASVQEGAVSPQSFVWETRGLPNGSTHSLRAEATDADTGQASASATVRVRNPPAVTLTAPADGAEVSGTLSLTAAATAPTGSALSSLAITLDQAALVSGPQATQTAQWDTTGLANGERHRVAAVATAADSTTASSSTTVEVRNPPALVLTVPDAVVSGGSGLVTATATAPKGTGLSRVELRVDEQVVASGQTPTVSFEWRARAAGTHRLSAYAEASDGTRATAEPVTVVVRGAPGCGCASAPGADTALVLLLAALATAGARRPRGAGACSR